MREKYFVIDTITLAHSLNFLGFSYEVFCKENGRKVYTFENTDKFQEAYKEICELRNKHRK